MTDAEARAVLRTVEFRAKNLRGLILPKIIRFSASGAVAELDRLTSIRQRVLDTYSASDRRIPPKIGTVAADCADQLQRLSAAIETVFTSSKQES